MRSFFSILLLLLFSFFLGCAKKDGIVNLNHAEKAQKLKLVAKKELHNLLKSGFGFTGLVWKDKIVIVHETAKKFYFSFYKKGDINKELYRLTFKKGKGPGEFVMQNGIRFFRDFIYIYAVMQGKILIFDEKGKFVDDFSLPEGDIFLSFFPESENNIFFSGMLRYRWGIYELKKGKILFGEKYDNIFKKFDPKKMRGYYLLNYDKSSFLMCGTEKGKTRIMLIDKKSGKSKKNLIDLEGDYLLLNVVRYKKIIVFNKPTLIKKTVIENATPKSKISTAVVDITTGKHLYNLEYEEKSINFSFVIPFFMDKEYIYYIIFDAKKGRGYLYMFENPIIF